MICFAGMVALIVTGYTVISGQQQLSAIQAKEHVYMAIGSIMVMFAAQSIYFFGSRASSMTTKAAYTTITRFGSKGWRPTHRSTSIGTTAPARTMPTCT